MDRLTQIEAFVAAVDHGSLTKAARDQNVTPAMIGRRIDALEKRLGVKLLHRSTRHLALTEEGANYVAQCRRILSDLDETEEALAQSRHDVTGRLMVSAPASFGRKHVAAHAPAFLQKYPQVEVSFNLSDQIVDVVRDRCDLAIRMGGVIDPNVVAIRLATNRRVVCGSPAYFSRHGVPRTLEEMTRHNCLAFNTSGTERRPWLFSRNGRVVSVQVNGTLDCNDGDLLHTWTLEGLGIQWRSLWEITEQLGKGELVTVLDDFALPDYDVMAVYARNRYVPERVRRFISHLKAVYSSKGYWKPS